MKMGNEGKGRLRLIGWEDTSNATAAATNASFVTGNQAVLIAIPTSVTGHVWHMSLLLGI